jgi:choline dehydrogenase-like flavoprotein
LGALIDSRTIPDNTVLETDVVIVGGGPAGISLALAFAESPFKVLLLEGGGRDFDQKIQALYQGSGTGIPYLPLHGSRLRYLGGSSMQWGGWCRPFDATDLEKRDWLPYSGWPFSRNELEPYYPRAQSLVEAGTWFYADAAKHVNQRLFPLGKGGVDTSWYQFSKTRNDVLPTYFGTRYAADLNATKNLTTYLYANVTGIRLSTDASRVEKLDVATLTGKKFGIRSRFYVLAAGALENARLLLVSNDVAKNGVGNDNDLVGRFFADHPIPRETATLVSFSGPLPPFYLSSFAITGAVVRTTFAPSEAYMRERNLLCSLTTVDSSAMLDEAGTAAVIATSQALGVDASKAKAYTLGCGLEPEPDPDRRVTLAPERDALGMQRLKLNMTISDRGFENYRETAKELGRQMLAAKSGMIRLNLRSRDEWLAKLEWASHHLGTTRMHIDPRQGVVDSNSRVHGIGNLFVAGGSVFPTYGATNPTLNLIALTLRLGDHIKGQFG